VAFDDALIGSDDFDPSAASEDLIRRLSKEPLPDTLDPRMLNTRLARKLNTEPPPAAVKPPKAPKADLDFSSQAQPADNAAPSEALDFTSQVEPPAATPAPSIGLTGNAVALAKGIPAGAAAATGGILKGAAALYDNGVPAAPAMPQYDPTGMPLGTQSEPTAAIPAKPLQERQLYKAGQAVEGAGPTMTPAEKESIGGRVGQMAGGIAPYAAATLAGGPAIGITAGFVGMAADTYGKVYEEAKASGADEDTARSAANKSALVAGVLGSLPLGVGKYAKSLAAKVVTSSAAFATAGEAQEALLEQIKKDYDPKAGYTLDQKRLIAELILGAGMGGLHHAFEPRQQPQPAAAGPQPTAGALPGGGPQPSAQAGAGPQARGGAQQPPPGSAAGPQPGGPGPQPGPQPGGARAQPPPGESTGPQPGPQPGKPPPGTGTGMGPDFTMDAATRAKMERVYRHFEPGKDPSAMADHELYNAVNEHLRDTSNTGYTAKPETAEEAAAREATATRRDEDETLKKAGWTDAHISSMTPEQRAQYLARARGEAPAQEPPKAKPAEAAPEEPATTAEAPTSESDVAAAGTREAPIAPKTADDVVAAQAAEPTPAQAVAGNYRHSHVELPQFGLTGDHSISIETGVGQERKGVDADGKPWSVTMTHGAYGRLKMTTGSDGEHLDAFVGPYPTSPYAFVIDQHDPKTGAYDEHKIMLGYRTPIDALHAYAHSYNDAGEGRIGHVTAMGPDEFKAWLKTDTTKPLKPGALPAPEGAGAQSSAEASVEGAIPEVPKATEVAKTKPAGSNVGSDQPLSLLQFIASKGGIKAHPELDAIGLTGVHRIQVPGRKGFFGTVRPSGMPLDRMREAAEEAGYLKGEGQKTSTVRDLLDAIDTELRGQKKHAEGEEGAKTKRETEAAAEREQHDRERHERDYGEAEKAIDAEYPNTPGDLRARAAKVMVDEGADVDSAMETAAMRLVGEDGDYGETEDTIKGTFGKESINAVRAESTHGNGKAPARAGEEERRPDQGEEAGRTGERVPAAGAEGREAKPTEQIVNADMDRQLEAEPNDWWQLVLKDKDRKDALDRAGITGVSPKAKWNDLNKANQKKLIEVRKDIFYGRPTLATERGVEGKPQLVIPGTEKASSATMAKRAAAAPLKPKTAQKPMDVGMFGTEKDQTDLLDALTSPAPKTPSAFDRWFGDSKVVDADGRPTVVYHGAPNFEHEGGTLGGFDVFDRLATTRIIKGRKPGMDNVGSWFSDLADKRGAEMYAGSEGSIYPVYLSIKNPFRPKSFDEYLATAHAASGSPIRTKADARKAGIPFGRGIDPEAMRAWLKDKGYDGIAFPKGTVDGSHQSVWVALEPTQIKSAIGNSGAFDPNNPSIIDATRRIEKALGPDAEKVAQVDIARAAEIMTENKGMQPAAAFGRAVVESAVNQGFITKQEAEQAYGKEVDVLFPGGEGAPRGGAPAEQGGAAPGEVRAGGPEENRELPRGGETGEGRNTEPARAKAAAVPATGKPEAAEQPTAGRNEPAGDEAGNAAGQEVATVAQPVGPYTIAEHRDIAKRINAGEITADELKAAFERARAGEADIRAELNKRTIAQLAPRGAGSMTKSRLVDEIYSRMLGQFAVRGGYSWSPMSEKLEDAIAREVAKTTDEDIKKAAEKRAERAEEIKQTYTDPKTYAEFESFIRVRGFDKLTPEQRVRYDEIVAERGREDREREQAKKAVVAKVDADVGMEMVETKHTQKGHDLFVVKMAARVPEETYKALASAAKRLGGYYSSYTKGGAVPGFQFTTKEAADAFMAVRHGDVSRAPIIEAKKEERLEGAVDNLRSQAETLERAAKESDERDRLVNTARRANMAAGAEAKAAADKALATSMRNLANAIESGEAKHLGWLRTRADVEMLDRLLRRAKYNWIEGQKPAGHGEREKLREKAVSAEMVDAANYPFPSSHVEDADKMARAVVGVKGVTMAAKRLLKDVRLAVSRKDWRVEAQTLGALEDLRTVAEAAAKQKGMEYTAKTALETFDDYNRLKRFGINNLPSLRAALREFLDHRGSAAKADPVKAAERALVGRKIPGYFPTPPELVDRMIDAADLKPGMRTLEPSAGKGNIADKLAPIVGADNLDTIEPVVDLRSILEAKGHRVVASDFLDMGDRGFTYGDVYRAPDGTLGIMRGSGGIGSNRVGFDPIDANGDADSRTSRWYNRNELEPVEKRGYNSEYDRVLMNPPFENGQDVTHVYKAFDMLKPGGRIVAIMSEHPFFANDNRSQTFRSWLAAKGGTSEKLPEGSFETSERSTGVNTRLVVIDKPKAPGQDILDSDLPRGEAAQAYVLDRGRTTGNEHLVVIDRDGKIVERSEGTHNSLPFPKALQDLLRDPDSDLVGHHNHPKSRSFSNSDIVAASAPGMRTIWAHGHNGSIYRANMTPEARRVLPIDMNKSFGMVQRLWYAIEQGVIGVMRANADLTNEDLRSDAQASISHLVNQALGDAGIINYETNFETPPSILAIKNLSDFLKRAADMARKELFREHQQASPDALDRRPESTRHPGNVGASFDRASVAKSVNGGGRPDQARGTGLGEEEPRGLNESEVDRKARAEAQGFDTNKVWYHKTNLQFDRFLPNAHFGTAEQANMRAVSSPSSIIPVYLRLRDLAKMKDTGSWDPKKFKKLSRQGYDGVVYLNRYEGIPPKAFERAHNLDQLSDAEFKKLIPEAQESVIVFDPKNIRSKFATFDPEDRSGKLLAEPDHPFDQNRPIIKTDNNPPEELPYERQLDRLEHPPEPTELPDHSVTLGVWGDASKVIKEFKHFWTSTFQPELVSDRALMADPLFARYRSAQAQEKDAVIRQSEKEWNYWNKRGDAERIRFIDDVETAVFGRVPADPVQAAMARRYRAMLDANWALEKRYGSQAAFVEDYFPHIWERPADWRAFAEAKSAQMGPTWFQKKRTIDYITDGLAAGLKLKYTNPVDIIVHRLMSGVDMRQRMELLYQLKNEGLAWEGAHGGAPLIDRGWRPINAPDRKQWVIHPDVQPLWKNAVEAKGLWQDEGLGGSIFRGWMSLKNAWVPVKLAWSAFHPLHVLHINYSNGMGQGWDNLTKGRDPIGALKAVAKGFVGPMISAPGATAGALVGTALGSTVGMPGWGAMGGAIAGSAAFGAAKRLGIARDIQTAGKEAREAWSTRPSQQTAAQKAVVALMNDGGFVPQLSEQLKIGAKRQLAVAFQKALRGEAKPGDWLKMVTQSMRRGLEIMQAPIFERWIPELKAGAYLEAASALMKRQPQLWTAHADRRLALRAISKQIDGRFGEMFYGALFWNRYVKDTGIGSFLSLGWNYGFVNQFGGAAMEAVTRPAGLFPPLKPSAPRRQIRDATNKIAFAIAYIASAALINALMTKLMSGDNPEGLDYIFARTGGLNPDGSPRRITNMFYLREVPMLLKHIQERGGNVLSGMGEMVWNKLMFEPFHELLNNRNYYGYNIWDENAPIYKQAWQALKHTMGDQNPMSITGAQQAARLSGREFPGIRESYEHPDRLLDALRAKGVDMSLLGFGPAPSYVEKSAMQNRIGYLYREHVAAVSKPQADEENSREKMAVRTAIMIAKRDKDQDMLGLAREKGKELGMSPKYMADIGKTPTDVYLFSRLPEDDQRSLLHGATPEETDRYLRHAHLKVRQEINRARYAPQPQPQPAESRL